MKNKTRKFKIALDERQLRILVDGLHKLPGEECIPLLGAIREQITEQMQNSHQTIK